MQRTYGSEREVCTRSVAMRALVVLAVLNLTAGFCKVPSVATLRYSVEFLEPEQPVVQLQWTVSSSEPGRQGKLQFSVQYSEVAGYGPTPPHPTPSPSGRIVTANSTLVLTGLEAGHSYKVVVQPCRTCDHGNSSTPHEDCSPAGLELGREAVVGVRYLQSSSVRVKSAEAVQVICRLARVRWTRPACLLEIRGRGLLQTHPLHTLPHSDPPLVYGLVRGLHEGAYTYTVVAVDAVSLSPLEELPAAPSSASLIVTASESSAGMKALLVVLLVLGAVSAAVITALVLEVIRHYRKASGVGCREYCTHLKEYSRLCCSPSSGLLELNIDDDSDNSDGRGMGKAYVTYDSSRTTPTSLVSGFGHAGSGAGGPRWGSRRCSEV